MVYIPNGGSICTEKHDNQTRVITEGKFICVPFIHQLR